MQKKRKQKNVMIKLPPKEADSWRAQRNRAFCAEWRFYEMLGMRKDRNNDKAVL